MSEDKNALKYRSIISAGSFLRNGNAWPKINGWKNCELQIRNKYIHKLRMRRYSGKYNTIKQNQRVHHKTDVPAYLLLNLNLRLWFKPEYNPVIKEATCQQWSQECYTEASGIDTTTKTNYTYEYDKVIFETDTSDNYIWNVQGINLISRKINGEMFYCMYNAHADITRMVDEKGCCK